MGESSRQRQGGRDTLTRALGAVNQRNERLRQTFELRERVCELWSA